MCIYVMLYFVLTGFDTDDQIPFYFDSQRLSLLREFIESMAPGSIPSAVLFSGPNGVGKSSIVLAAAIHSFARGLIRVYIPMAGMWYFFSDVQHISHTFISIRVYMQGGEFSN